MEGEGPERKEKWDGEGKRGRGVMALLGGAGGRPEVSLPRSFLKVGAYAVA